MAKFCLKKLAISFLSMHTIRCDESQAAPENAVLNQTALPAECAGRITIEEHHEESVNLGLLLKSYLHSP
jgi:hypothetical protein